MVMKHPIASALLVTLISVLLQSVKASTSVTSAPTAQGSHSVASSNATCPYRTINYITHQLPQQCLTTSWASTTATLLANATDVVSSTEASTAPEPIGGVGNGSVNHTAIAKQLALESISGIASPATATSSSTGVDKLLSTSASLVPSNEPEESSPLDDDKFMSFEEWKRQNLQKAGQSEHIGRDRGEPQLQPQRRRPANLHSALDSLGDDAEIDLDFTGFIPDGPDLASVCAPAETGEPQNDQVEAGSPPSVPSRSKDAGTTSKERLNYASFDCSADILKANSEVSSAGAVLGENKDNYMLNTCSANNKFLILKLCDDISIDTIVLANFEFFSSIFRTFRVSVSDKYPIKADKWKTIGTFEARNTRDVQAFLIENPIIWARFLRIEFLTHYGNEYYCPVSLVRVHGTTMLEEYKLERDSEPPNEDDISETIDIESSVKETPIPDLTVTPTLEEKDEHLSSQNEPQTPSTDDFELKHTEIASTEPITSHPVTVGINQMRKSSDVAVSPSSQFDVLSSLASPELCSSSPVIGPAITLVKGSAILTSNTSATVISQNNRTTETLNISTKTDIMDGTSTSTSTSTSTRQSSTTPENSSLPPSSSVIKHVMNTTITDRQKATPSSTQSSPAAPTMQDSFFKSIQKRLQMLESNSSLSLEYIEDQSRALRDAFNKVEQRQLAKTTTFLEYLNTTVISELRDFRQQYDQLWQSTVIELQMQRERYQQENAIINARLGILADELIFQKRVSILQMVLILICLALVLFAKGTLNQYLELPVVQRVLTRSPSNKWLNFSTLDTPTQSPPATRHGSLRKREGILKTHRRLQSEDSIEGSLSPNDAYPSPPTSTHLSYEEQSDGEAIKVEKLPPPLEDPEFDPSMIERPSTSPPILPSEMASSTGLNGIEAMDTIESRLDIGLSSPPSSPDMNGDQPLPVPRLVVEEASPERHSKHLTWKLSDS